MKFSRQRSQEVGVDLTPLIDVVFLLLIFFMAEVKQIDVVINAEGQYVLNDKALVNNRRETLERGVNELSEGDTALPFIITADARTPHEYVVRAMDVAGRLGFSRLSITTEREAGSQ